MAIKSNALAENKAAILSEDGGTIYATLQMRHGKESEMDGSKFVPAEIGVATDTRKAFMAFAPGDTKEFAFKDDIPEIPEQDKNYNNLENKPSIGGVELSGDKTLEELGIQPKGDYVTEIPEEYVTDTELTEKLKSYPTKQNQTTELNKKLNKNQGESNKGKMLVVDENGDVIPEQISMKVDDTLSQPGQAADAEKVGARLHEIDAVKLRGPVETVSGEILQIENPAEQPPAGMRVYGKAKQNTTTGAQLLNAPDKTNKIFGVTMSVSGGIASFSGTLSSNNATFWFIGSYNGTDVVMTLPAGRYYLQNCSMQTLGNSALKTGAITSETEIQITGVAYTYTDSSPKTIYPMINAGSTALPWEPYTGRKPSPSPEYPQEIEIPGSDGKIETSMNGKNLATGRLYYVTYSKGVSHIRNKNTVALPYTPLSESDGVGYIIPCKKGCTYTLSGTNLNENASLGIAEYKNEEEANDYKNSINYIMAGNSAEKQKTISAIGDGVLVCVLASVWTDGKSRIHTCTERELLQVEIGEEATEYEPPRKPQSLTLSTPNGLPGIPVKSGGNYTDSEGQQWVCDEVDFERGIYVQRITKIILDGEKSYSLSNNTSNPNYTEFAYNIIQEKIAPNLNSALLSDRFLAGYGDVNPETDHDYLWLYTMQGMQTASNLLIVISNKKVSNDNGVKKFFAENPTTVYLPLANPVETSLSSQEIAAYRALNLNSPVTNVFTVESLMPGIAVDYVPETEQYIEKSINENTQKAPAIVEKASGEMLNVADSSDLRLKGLKLFGKSEQVKTTGAQLFDASKLESKQSDGITITNNGNGSFTINGTSTGYPGTSYNIALKNGMYYISTKDEVDVKNIFRVRIRKNDSYKDKGVGTSFEIDGTEDQVQIYIQADTGFTFNNVVIYPMLNAGESPLPWEPFTGEKPSPSPEYPQEIEIPGESGEIEMKVTGENLIPFPYLYRTSVINGVSFTVNDDNSVLVNGTADDTAIFYFFDKNFNSPMVNGKTYCIYDFNDNLNNSMYMQFWNIDGNGTFAFNQGGIKSFVFTNTSSNYNCVLVVGNNMTVNNVLIKPMLVEGSEALPWEPYKHQSLTLSTPNGLPGIPVDSGGNYTDEKGQQWICDEVDFERGKYIQRVIKKENPVFAKNGDYAVEGSELYFCSIPEISETKETALPGAGISTYMQYTTTVLNRNETGFYIGYGGIWARIKDVGDLDAFNAKLQDAVFYFTYKGIPETETDLLEKQLKAYRALHTNYPTTNVSTDSTPQAGLEMEYVADTKSYIDKKFEELQKALVNTNTQVLNKVMEDIEHV